MIAPVLHHIEQHDGIIPFELLEDTMVKFACIDQNGKCTFNEWTEVLNSEQLDSLSRWIKSEEQIHKIRFSYKGLPFKMEWIRFGEEIKGTLRKSNFQTTYLSNQIVNKPEELSQFLDKINAVFLVLNANLEVVYLNNHGAKKLGLPLAFVIGEQWLDKAIPPAESDRVKKHFNQLKKKKDTHQFEHYFLTSEEEKIHINWSTTAVLTENGDIKSIVCIGEDITERKRIEKELAQSEHRYRTLVERMGEGVLMVDHQQRIRFANKAFSKITGFKKQELLGKVAHELLLPKSDWEVMEKKNESRLEGKSEKYDFQIQTKNGKKVWIHVSAVPIKDANGKVIGSMGLHTDITERKRYEKEIRRIALFPMENPNPVLRVKQNGKVSFTNVAGQKILEHWGIQLGEKIGSKIKKEFDVAVKKNQAHEIIIRHEGEYYSLLLTPIDNGKYINVYGSNITQLRRSNAEIRKLSVALSQSKNGIIILDLNGSIEWVNEGFCNMSGYAMEELIGTRGELVRDLQNDGQFSKRLKQVFKHAKPISYDSLNYRKDGDPYWSYTTLSPFYNIRGDLTKVIAVEFDITDKKKTEQALIEAKEIAEKNASAKELFLANMSHEIRTPMNAIMGIAQLMQEDTLSDQHKEYLNSIMYAGNNLVAIINDILDITKIEAGKMPIQENPFDLKEACEKTLEALSYRIEEKPVKLKMSYPASIPHWFKGDALRVNQILTNLLGNAIKFTQEGKIDLKVSHTKKGVQLQVIDTGSGIKKEDQDKIFEAFEQSQTPNHQKVQGTGLGLAIVKRIVDLMKGKIEVKSEWKKGTTFKVTLPIEPIDEAGETAEVLADEISSLEGVRILLAEDNALNQMVAKKFLQKKGMIVEVASDGQQAINMAEKSNYDVILMDIQMREKDGYQAAKEIKESLGAEIKIIAMTAHAFRGEEQKCLDAGMNDYISKPLKKELLYQKIAAIVAMAEKETQ